MSIDWNVINAIGCWFAGVVTALGVYLTWKQIRDRKNKHLKLELKYHFIFANSIIEVKHLGTILALKIMNDSEHKVTIEEWGFVLNNKQRLTVIPKTSPVGADLPVTIDSDSCATLSIYIQDLQNELLKSINNGAINENLKLKVYARDSFSKYYQQKTDVTYKQLSEYAKLQVSNS